MADIERTIRNLTVRLEESRNDRRLTMTIKFSVRLRVGPDGVDNYTITIPGMVDEKVNKLFADVRKATSDVSDSIRDLIVEDDILIELQTP